MPGSKQPTMTCDDYQMAFDQLAAGATSPLSAGEVDAHVAACATCTAYASLSRKVHERMMNTISISPSPLALDVMRARIAHFRRQARRGVTIFPVAFGALTLIMQRFIVPSHPSWIAAVVTAVAGAAIAWAILAFLTRRRLASLTELHTTSDDGLVAGLRAELDRRIRNEVQGWWVLPIVLAAFHWRFVGWALPSGPLLVFELCYLALFPLGIVRYRRAKRELALLG